MEPRKLMQVACIHFVPLILVTMYVAIIACTALCLYNAVSALKGTSYFASHLERRAKQSVLLAKHTDALLSEEDFAEITFRFFDKLYSRKAYRSSSEFGFLPSSKIISESEGLKPATIDLRAYPPVDLEGPVQAATDKVMCALNKLPGEFQKGQVVVVRGAGGGKSRALLALRNELKKDKYHVLPVLISFSNVDDFVGYKKIFSRTAIGNPCRVMALATIARIASSVLNITRGDSVKLYQDSKAEIRTIFGKAFGYEIVSHLLIYLAKRTEGVTGVVLIVDAADMAEEALQSQYSDAKEGLNTLRTAMLLCKYGDFVPGLHGALVLAGKQASMAGIPKVLYPVVLCEQLNASAVVDNLFLKDLDTSTRLLHPVVAKSPLVSQISTAACREALVRVATSLSSLPRAIEYAQNDVHRHIDRTGKLRTVTVSPQLVEQVFEEVLSKLQATDPSLRAMGLPSAHLMYALLYGKKVLVNRDVTAYIGASVFVNSLDIPDFPWIFNEPATIKHLRSSIVSLNAALGDQSGWVQRCVKRLFELTRRWAAEPLTSTPAGPLLVDLALEWMRTKLAAATTNRNVDVPLLDLLNLIDDQVEDRRINDVMFTYLDERIALPTKQPSVEVVQLQERFRDPACTGDVVDELNTITLAEEDQPWVLLRAAEGDCFSYALAFLGKTNRTTGRRPKRIVFFNIQLISELDPGAVNTLPTDASLIPAPTTRGEEENAPDNQYMHLQRVALEYSEANKEKASAGDGLGDAVARGEFIYTYQTTLEGESYTVDNVLTIGRQDSEAYFSFMYGPFAPDRASFRA